MRRAAGDNETNHSGLVAALRSTTRELHVAAEKSGILRELLVGRGSVYGYAMLIRNLLPAYAAMESILRRSASTPGFGPIADPGVYRQAAIESDLCAIAGSGWRTDLPLLPVGERYAHRVRSVRHDERLLWLGHVYTRYLGDLNGGRILRRVLSESLRLGEEALHFYQFPRIGDVRRFQARYREALDIVAPPEVVTSICREAGLAFRYNIALSEAIAASCGPSIQADEAAQLA
jgi:heme oxygenase